MGQGPSRRAVCHDLSSEEKTSRPRNRTTMNEQQLADESITGYARILNAAHLLAEESARKLHELASRYPDALPQEVVSKVRPPGGGPQGTGAPRFAPATPDGDSAADDLL